MSVKQKTSIEDVHGVIDEAVVNTVFGIFEAVTKLNLLDDIFNDLSEALIAELHNQSFMEFNLELTEEQKEALKRVIAARGNAAVRKYLANIDMDKRTKDVYQVCKDKTESIVDRVLASIGQEVNRGAIINAVAVQANAKNEDYNEILLRTGKNSGDVTIPINCVLISTNCVAVIKTSCGKEPEQGKDAADSTVMETVPEADVSDDLNISEREDNRA